MSHEIITAVPGIMPEPQKLASPEPQELIAVPDFGTVDEYAGSVFPKKGDLRVTTEPVPDHYHFGASPELTFEQQQRLMVENLRSEILWSETSGETLRSVYGVMRSLSDLELGAVGASMQSKGAQLIDESRWYATPNEYATKLEEGEAKNTIGLHTEKGIEVDLERVFESEAQNVANTLSSWGVELKNPSDALMLTVSHIVAHEAGHAVTSGISTFAAGLSNRAHARPLLASTMALSAQPEQGFTGNLETDIWIQEERFAEGYARVGVTKMLRLLDYDDQEIATILAAVNSDIGISAPEGIHQIDNLVHYGEGANPHTVGDQELVKAHGQDYLGNLGYWAPFQPDELVTQLATVREMLLHENPWEAERIVAEASSPGRWNGMVESSQSDSVKAHISNLQSARAKALQRLKQQDSTESEHAEVGVVTEEAAPTPEAQAEIKRTRIKSVATFLKKANFLKSSLRRSTKKR